MERRKWMRSGMKKKMKKIKKMMRNNMIKNKLLMGKNLIH